MRLSHSISMTMLVSTLASLTGCGEEAEPGDTSNGGTGMGGSATGGSATGGSATGGSATGGSATGGSATGGSGGGMPDYPTDTTQAGIEAYLMMELYKGAGWRPEATPSDGMSPPHLAVKRYFNETIIASKAAGNRPPSMGQHTAGSMSVKEILDGTTVIGKAAMLRTATGNIYYCKSSVGTRCATADVANDVAYYAPAVGPCACHGSGTNTSHDAIPAL